MKESYIKLPNITVGKLQDVVDFLDDNNIEYIEEYKENEELQERINKAIEYIHNHQLVFEISSKKQIAYWFDMFYKEVIDILKGEE